jgi:hypothetical protein
MTARASSGQAIIECVEIASDVAAWPVYGFAELTVEVL